MGIQLMGRIDHRRAAALIRTLKKEITSQHPVKVSVDLNRITYFDDFGVLVLTEIRKFLDEGQIPFSLIQPPPRPGEVLALFNFDDPSTCALPKVPTQGNPIVRLGEGFLHQLYHLRYLVSFLGSAAICLLHVILHPKKMRWNDTVILMQKTGVDAVPIVGLISFLLGLIMAFVSSLQLEQFGASIYVASLVALAMVSELGPIMTAIVVAGRSGSAFAAEIGTMRISDEIDALFTMGISPTLFLVVPRMVATVIVVPMLTLFADLFAIFGGLHLSQHADLEDQCPNGQCPPELEEDADSGRTYQAHVGDGLVVGLVGVAAGAAMFFTTDWFIGGDAKPTDKEAGWAFRPQLRVGPGSVMVRGRF